MIESIVILAGGLATRLYPVTQKIPKSMIEIAGAPFIHHQMQLLKKNGIKTVVLCVGHLCEQIKDFMKDGRAYGLEIRYSEDGDKLLGTGGAIKKALSLLDDVFFIMYGDSYLDIDFNAVSECFSNQNKIGLMTIINNENRWDRSNIVFSNGAIVTYDKRSANPEMRHIDYGLGILRKSAFAGKPDGMIFDLSDIYVELIQKNEMLGYEVFNRFYEIGSPQGIQETSDYILAKN